MVNKISVFVLTHRSPYKSHVSHLASLFRDQKYDYHVDACVTSTIDERVISCLQRSFSQDPDSYTLILTDRVLTAHSSDAILKILETCIKSVQFDLAYLYKYNDKCQMHAKIKDCGPVTIVRSQEPKGLEAILYSPSGRDILLAKKNSKVRANCNKGIEKAIRKLGSDIRCVATTPNVFSYDVLNNVTTCSGYEKGNECAPLQLDPVARRAGDDRRSLIIFFLLVVVALLTYALLSVKYSCCTDISVTRAMVAS